MRPRLGSFALLALALCCLGLVVDGPLHGGSERAPPDNPGWAHVGMRGAVTAVHIARGWILTARHAQPGDVVFDGVSYPLAPDSWKQIENPDAPGSGADLMLLRVDPAPELPDLELREVPLASGMHVTLVGYGQARGEAMEWNGLEGFRWDGTRQRRWGTNRVRRVGVGIPMLKYLTQSFDMEFDRPGTKHEAQAAIGDSGGAVFARRAGRWELAGIMVTINTLPGQPPATAMIGNVTSAADVSYYRPRILRTIAEQEAALAPQP